MSASSWREVDLRGDRDGVPNSIGVVVRRARLGLRTARGGESLLLAAAGLCVTLSAAVLSGLELARVDAWLVGAVGALACGTSWWLEHRSSEREVAVRIDERLRHQGALVTAWELEARRDASPFRDLLDRRVRSRLRPGEALRAIRPSLGIPVAVPLLAAAALAVSLEIRRERASPAIDHRALAAGLAERLDQMSGPALSAGLEHEIPLEAAQDLRQLARRARALEQSLDRPETDREEALAELATLDALQAELLERLPPTGELHDQLAASRAFTDALREGLAPGATGPGGSGAGSGLTAEAETGTMPGSESGGESVPDASEPEPAGAGAGALETPPVGVEAGTTAAGRWWSAAHDPVVELWFDALRSERGAGDTAND
jgi:hypothetical protein